MAIFGAEEETVKATPIPSLVDREYDTASVSNKRQPMAQLISYIEGSSWTIQYYAQILGRNDAPTPFQYDLDETLQQYHRINEYEIKVQSPLSYQHEADRQEDVYTGSGTTYVTSLIPTRGDMFIADVGDGRFSVFTVTNVTPLSYMMETVYEISYMSVALLDTVYESAIEAKVVKTSYFIKDFLINGSNPVLSGEEVNSKERIDHHGSRLIDLYQKKFISSEHRMLMVPDQQKPTFDYFLSEFIQETIETSQHNRFRSIGWPEISNLSTSNSETLWTLLQDQTAVDTKAWLTRLESTMVTVGTWALKHDPSFGGIYYSGVERLVWPYSLLDGEASHTLVESPYDDETPVEEPPETDPEDPIVDPEEPEEIPEASQVKEPIYPVLKDEYYVLSESFYSGDRIRQSELEYLITQMLNREVIPMQRVVLLCEKSYFWRPLEQFYYIPILFLLMRYVVRRM